jgi:histidinol phosphatase-like enzyme
MKVEKFLTKEELEATQAMHNEFNKLKIQLADVELQKHGLLKHIDMLRLEFQKHEKGLMDKYGEDAVINLQTGEVTKK